MNPQAIANAVDLISFHGYWFVFFAMLIEGPVVTTAAAFASALGYYDIFAIFILSILGDIVGDILYFFIGRWGRINLVEKFGKRFGLKKKKVNKIEELLKNNTWATISAIKLAPGLATPGLIITGASNVSFKSYIKICLYITLPRSLIFVLLGYYAGQANATAEKYLHHSRYTFILAVLIIIVVNWSYKKAAKIISQKIERI